MNKDRGKIQNMNFASFLESEDDYDKKTNFMECEWPESLHGQRLHGFF